MEKYRLKIKIGDNEFEAEGSESTVKAQFEAFRDLVLNAPVNVQPPPKPANNNPQVLDTNSNNTTDEHLERIMNVDKRVVSLTIKPSGVDEAILLLLYGQKVLRDNSSVTGAEIIEGLETTGLRVARIDRNMEKAGEEGDVIVIGQRRSKRYRLTNQGITKARDISNKHIANVA